MSGPELEGFGGREKHKTKFSLCGSRTEEAEETEFVGDPGQEAAIQVIDH